MQDIETAVKTTAVTMLKQDLDIKLISQVTGLTFEEIKKIQYSS